jgi:hypothetical protein
MENISFFYYLNANLLKGQNFLSPTQAVGFEGGTVEQSENQRKKQELTCNKYRKTFFPSPAKTHNLVYIHTVVQ